MNTLVENAGVNIHIAWGWGCVAGAFSEFASLFLDVFNISLDDDENNKIEKTKSSMVHFLRSMLIDSAIAPTLSMATFCCLKAYCPHVDDFHKSTATVMSTLIVRHLIKKWFNCCPDDVLESKDDKKQAPKNKKWNERHSLFRHQCDTNISKSNHNKKRQELSDQHKPAYGSLQDNEQDSEEEIGNINQRRRIGRCVSFCQTVSSFCGGFFYRRTNSVIASGIPQNININAQKNATPRHIVVELSPSLRRSYV
jgi:hypothetical protein